MTCLTHTKIFFFFSFSLCLNIYFKKQVLNEIAQHKIKIYEFPDVDDEELRKSQRALRERVPFAVVGSNTVVEVDGRKIRGRRYPWGVVEGFMAFVWLKRIHFWFSYWHFLVENMEHCDFIALRNMLIRTHMTDLKEVTNNVHYENFRCRKLAGVGVAANDGTLGKSNRISNKLVFSCSIFLLFSSPFGKWKRRAWLLEV